MRGFGFCFLVAILAASAARADEAAPASTAAFDKAYAASFYEFDACGDGIAGRIYRTAMTAKVKQCPFSDEAKKRFQLRSALQRRKSSQVMAKMIEDNGGLPVRLDGMTRSCHEQMESPEYRSVRSRLDAFAAGKAGADSVVPQPCDAAEISP
jgi:hypothetical protein